MSTTILTRELFVSVRSLHGPMDRQSNLMVIKILIQSFKLVKNKDNKSIRRKERLFELPICKTDCHDWFNDCQNDYTCQSNWYKGFQWKNGT